ncbi:RelA/SpoT family protein [Basilea psittacipulmonis]|uniref:RelA/SpoT family protein n=1 Tax=Basilea psittacipulmonis TaxID=1472345 RepID=UPI000984C585|nr:bifunctional (p)ppGpp synthetase/guanosine-3',5'-bis(diphosphate) 3'-pyrophosphohydrolase [Basilea psittacipulmonis]
MAELSENQVYDKHWLDSLTQHFSAQDKDLVARCASWVNEVLDKDDVMPTGENRFAHGKGTTSLLSMLQLDATTIVSAMLTALPIEQLESGAFKQEIINRFGLDVAQLVNGTCGLIAISLKSREQHKIMDEAEQQEMLRKLLLAMATDLRIVLMRLCSRLQTLRWYAASKHPCPTDLSLETRGVYAPLANRLGIWQIKWELEDLSFRFLEPDIYKEIAKKLEVKRIEREGRVNQMIAQIQQSLQELKIQAEVVGRAKHIYSIYNKMRNKHLNFEQLYDLQALRVIVDTESECYSVLSFVHTRWTPVIKEYDDYIARPKPNGYRSLHTVIKDDDGFVYEVQIRTQEMHNFAECGMAAHWRYKEAGAKGGQVSASSFYDRQVAWMRELIAWRQEVGVANSPEDTARLAQKEQALLDSKKELNELSAAGQHKKIYVLTPQAKVIELTSGSTPIDFAYALHTDLGHRCRGAKVNGHMVPLSTKLQTGQTVEIIAAKTGGPSRDWLNPELGYLAAPRSKVKVRNWFNAIELQNRITTGQEMLEKELQRLGKTATNLEQLAAKFGLTRADDLFIAIAKEDISLRQISQSFSATSDESDELPSLVGKRGVNVANVTKTGKSGVLVVGVDSLLTQLAGCCHPAPPDEIGGFITMGRGVSIHRVDCSHFKELKRVHQERIVEVDWGYTGDNFYPVSLKLIAQDRNGLLRDVSELFARLKLNVIAVNTWTKKGVANLVFTIEVNTAQQLQKAISSLSEVEGVHSAQRI